MRNSAHFFLDSFKTWRLAFRISPLSRRARLALRPQTVVHTQCARTFHTPFTMPGVSLAFAAGVAQTITSLQRRPLLEGCTEGHVKTKGLSFQRCGRVMARRSLHLCTGRRATAVAVLRNGDTKNGHDGKRSSGIPPLAESLLLPHPNPLAVGNDREQLQETADGKEQVADEFNVGNDSRWPTLHETLWEFNESTAMARGALGSLIAPAWRVMLLSDGSVTRHLQLLTDAKVLLVLSTTIYPFSP